jgi:hypothetical protein
MSFVTILLGLTEPIRVEFAEVKSPPGWLDSLSRFAWPVAMLVVVLIYRRALSSFLSVISQRASEISIGTWASFKLPTLSETPLDQDVIDFKNVQGGMLTESYKAELFKQFRSPRKDEFAVINLGAGSEWISSRLFIFSVMLQRMKSLKCIVFLQKTDTSEKTYIGAASIDSVRWGLASIQPWLEAAYARAYAQFAPDPQTVRPFSWIVNNKGALQPHEAENVVRGYVRLLLPAQPQIAPADPTEWVQLSNGFEHARWVTQDEVEQFLGDRLWRDAVHKIEDRREFVGAIVRCSSPYVAITNENGEFISLVNRIELLNRIARKLN